MQELENHDSFHPQIKPKCKLDEDPCDESDGGGVSECPGVWLGRGMPIGLGEEENPRLL